MEHGVPLRVEGFAGQAGHLGMIGIAQEEAALGMHAGGSRTVHFEADSHGFAYDRQACVTGGQDQGVRSRGNAREEQQP